MPSKKGSFIINQDHAAWFRSTHPKFSQFQLPKQDAPLTDLPTRYKIFTISLLLRFTGYFMKTLKVWAYSRCENISAERFLTQLNSQASIFKGNPRTLAQVREDLCGIAIVSDDIISVISQDNLINRLKQALENYQYAAIWYRAHTAPLVERQRKRAPRAHWQTLKLRMYISKVRWRNKRWGVNLKPLTIMKMRERIGYCEQIDQTYLFKYHMTRSIPKKHRNICRLQLSYVQLISVASRNYDFQLFDKKRI